jgi:nitrogen fixation NifU-like protein
MELHSAYTDLYRDIVRRHARAPHGVGDIYRATARAESYNAHCGDRIAVSLRLALDRRIELLRHSTEACLLCTASASLMSQHVVGLVAADAEALSLQVGSLVMGEPSGSLPEELDALAGVVAFPARRRCVMLPWETLGNALRQAAMRMAFLA